MSNLQKYYDELKVHITKGCFSTTSTCNKEGCKNHDEYLIFVGGYKMSDLEASCCPEHLSEFVSKAIDERDKKVHEYVKRDEEKKYEDALKIIRSTKLKKLES